MIKLDGFSFNKRTAFELNQLVASADYAEVGQFRNRGVQITGTGYRPPLFTTLPGLWDDLEERIRKQKDPKEAGFNAFLEIARNQYFNNGNKRTGQLMMNGILMSNNLHIVTFPDKAIPDFFDKIINYYETGDKAQMKNLLNQRQEEMEQAFSKSGDG